MKHPAFIILALATLASGAVAVWLVFW